MILEVAVVLWFVQPPTQDHSEYLGNDDESYWEEDLGYIVNHAVVVSGEREAFGDYVTIPVAHEKAVALLGDLVSPIVNHRVNFTASFFVSPHGSKSGWEDAETANAQRDAFIEWLRGQKGLSWVEVEYGEDSDGSVLKRHYRDGAY